LAAPFIHQREHVGSHRRDLAVHVIRFFLVRATLCYVVVAVPFLPWIEPAAWKYLVASVLIHVLYYTFLLKAYSYGDLSHTYPIARGLGPLLVALVSGNLIGEHLRVQDMVGVALLSFGLITLAIPLKAVKGGAAGRHGLATLFAVLTGVTIAAYIIADGMGVRSAGPGRGDAARLNPVVPDMRRPQIGHIGIIRINRNLMPPLPPTKRLG